MFKCSHYPISCLEPRVDMHFKELFIKIEIMQAYLFIMKFQHFPPIWKLLKDVSEISYFKKYFCWEKQTKKTETLQF